MAMYLEIALHHPVLDPLLRIRKHLKLLDLLVLIAYSILHKSILHQELLYVLTCLALAQVLTAVVIELLLGL